MLQRCHYLEWFQCYRATNDSAIRENAREQILADSVTLLDKVYTGNCDAERVYVRLLYTRAVEKTGDLIGTNCS